MGNSGAVACVHYFVADGAVTICDKEGNPTKKMSTLAEGDDPRAVAARMGHAAWVASGDGSDFNRPLVYPTLGVA